MQEKGHSVGVEQNHESKYPDDGYDEPSDDEQKPPEFKPMTPEAREKLNDIIADIRSMALTAVTAYDAGDFGTAVGELTEIAQIAWEARELADAAYQLAYRVEYDGEYAHIYDVNVDAHYGPVPGEWFGPMPTAGDTDHICDEDESLHDIQAEADYHDVRHIH